MVAHLPAIITLLALFLGFATAMSVGVARAKYGVQAPATSGNENFERVFRVQMNTLENLVLFLPALWLFSSYVSQLWAGVIGAVWLLGRIDYAVSYTRSATARSRGFGISVLAFSVLAFGALIGIAQQLITGI